MQTLEEIQPVYMSDTPAPPSSEAETLASLRAALKNRRQDTGQQAEKSSPPTAEPEQTKAEAPLPEIPAVAAPSAQTPKIAETPVPAKPEQPPAPQQQTPRPPKENWEPTPPKPQHQQQQQKKKQHNPQEQRKNPPRPPQQQEQQRKPQQQQTPPSQPAPKPEAEEESPADRLKRLLDSHRQKASQDLEKKPEKETPPTPPSPPAPKEPEKKEEPAASPVDALRKQMEEKRLARQNTASTAPISLEKSPPPDVVKPAPPKVSLEKTPLTVPAPQAFMPPSAEAMPSFVYQDPLQKRNANPFAGVIAQFDKLKRTALGRFLKSLIKFTQNTLAVLTWTILFAIPCNLAFLSIINFDAFDARYWNALNILYTTSTVPWVYVLTLLGAAFVWLLGAILAWYKGWKYCGRVYGVVLKISLLPLGFFLLIVYGICRLIQEIINRR